MGQGTILVMNTFSINISGYTTYCFVYILILHWYVYVHTNTFLNTFLKILIPKKYIIICIYEYIQKIWKNVYVYVYVKKHK